MADLPSKHHALDTKTGTATYRDYRYQLWLYARALGKSRAVIADLAKGAVIELTEGDLDALGAAMTALVSRLRLGGSAPTPSETAYRFCSFKAGTAGTAGVGSGLCEVVT